MPVQNSRVQRKNALREHISKHDLEEDMRLDAKTDDLSKIQLARLEPAATSASSKPNNAKPNQGNMIETREDVGRSKSRDNRLLGSINLLRGKRYV